MSFVKNIPEITFFHPGARCSLDNGVSILTNTSTRAKTCFLKWTSSLVGFCWLPSMTYFPRNIGNNHHPNWRTHIFPRGGPTTNQLMNIIKFGWTHHNSGRLGWAHLPFENWILQDGELKRGSKIYCSYGKRVHLAAEPRRATGTVQPTGWFFLLKAEDFELKLLQSIMGT